MHKTLQHGPRAAVLFSAAALALAAGAVRAAPPTLVSLVPDAPKMTTEELIPISPEATPEQKALFEEVIAESRETDVSVTEDRALLYAGLQHVSAEEYEEAIPLLEEVLRRDPALLTAWEGLGWSYIRTGDLQRGIRLWNYFQRLMPEQALPYTLLAQSDILQQNWNAADANFKKSLKIKPDQYDVAFWYAQNLLRIGQNEEAEKIFRDLLRRDEANARHDVKLNLAMLLTQKLEYDEAVEIYRDINEALPGNPTRLLEQAVLELRVGELHTADQICIDTIELIEDTPYDPEGDTYVSRIPEKDREELKAQAMRVRADIAEIDGMSDLRPFQEVIDLTDNPVERSAMKIRLANRCHLVNRKAPGTYGTDFILNLMSEAVSDDPHNVATRLIYAERLAEAERFFDSHNQLLTILNNYNRHCSRAKMALFNIALREHRFEDAEQIHADLFHNFDSSDPMAYYYKARIYIGKGMYSEALKELDQMEAAADQGCVLSLLYEDMTESDWAPVTSVRRLHEHIAALIREGWTLVSPMDIPNLVGLKPGESRQNAETDGNPPATARIVDYVRWAITGTRKFKPRNPEEGAPKRPNKYFCVTFDGSLRSSLVLGTDVARDFGVPFGIFTPTEPPEQYTSSRAGWHELREAAKSGYWVVGTQLHGSYIRRPVNEEGDDIRAPLCNRIWISDEKTQRNRQESMNEWDRRVRSEFKTSVDILREEMGPDDAQYHMVAYPFGDIGQDDACNLMALRNPMQSILSEAGRTYQLGFLQSASGYTVSGDNLLMVRRYRPPWTEEGSDIVRHAYEYHPTFIARRLRAEIAMLMNRPNLALDMLSVLRRDGYPEELCRKMETEIHAHFQNKPNRELRPLTADTTDVERQPGKNGPDVSGATEKYDALPAHMEDEAANAEEAAFEDATDSTTKAESWTLNPTARTQQGSIDPYVDPNGFFIGAELDHSKANDQIELLRYGLRAGFNPNKNTTLSAEYFASEFKQVIIPRWNAQVTTNVPFRESRYKFKVATDEIRLNMSHRLESGVILSGSIGRARKRQLTKNRDSTYYTNLQDALNSHDFTLHGNEEATLLTLGATFSPIDNLALHFFYDRNYVVSAAKNVVYESAAANAQWKPEDSWLVNAHARYWTYEDDNAMFSSSFDSVWEVNPELGVWLGFQYSVTTTSDPSDFYWTPYWDQRLMGVFRYQQAREGYRLVFDILAGMQGNKGRADRAYEQPVTKEKEILIDGVANTVTEETTEFVIAEDADSGWHRSWGASAKYEKMLNTYLTLSIEASAVAYRDYIDHFVLFYFRASF